MRILIVANHYPVCSARYMTAACARLGHDVRHVGAAMGRHIWGLELDARTVWQPDGDLDTRWRDWQPDLVVVMDSDPAILNTVDFDAPTVVYGVDNHVRDYRRPQFDRYFLAHRGVSLMDWGGDMQHLPCAYDPVTFTPSPLPFAERPYDVAMIGVMYPQRWALVDALKAAGLRVAIGTGLVYEQYARVYHQARVSLCASFCGDVAQRVFETAALGCVVLSDPCPDFALLQPRGVLVYRDLDEAVALAQVALHEGAPLAVESQAWVRGHTWDARAREIVGFFASDLKRRLPHGLTVG